MKNRVLLTISIIAGIVCLLVSQSILAGTDVQSEIRMENKTYTKHKKGIVMFPHEKHSKEYLKQFSDIYENGCGECHHDKDNAPLVDLKADDPVQPCIECHPKPGERPKGKGATKLSKTEKLQYHAEAIHANCKACHKAVNKKTGKKSAPTTCAKCHPKKK
ncbi:cytochrome c3 family protein [Thermodesulfobacteriota bacterium]